MHVTGVIVIGVLIVLVMGSALLVIRPGPGGTGERSWHRPDTRFPDPTRGFRDPFR